nr:phage holin [Halalkalibacterium ligniniphilum]
MKINWKVRSSNPLFWVQVFLAITDPTTNGHSDSIQARGYVKPKKDVR